MSGLHLGMKTTISELRVVPIKVKVPDFTAIGQRTLFCLPTEPSDSLTLFPMPEHGPLDVRLAWKINRSDVC